MLRAHLHVILVILMTWNTYIASSEASSIPDHSTCRNVLENYQNTLGIDKTHTNISNAFIFFLHVPRTAGKTYASCFLRAAIPPTQRCAPSYDILRYNISQEGCRYLVSHDDYSFTQQLPENTLVITQLRDPVARALSAYEFAIEIAARRLDSDDASFAIQQQNITFINSLKVWPWSHLVPYFRSDMRSKLFELKEEAANSDRPVIWEEHHDAKRNRTFYYNKLTKESVWEKPKPEKMLHPYMNPLVISLVHWIESDEAREFIHNGATLQLLGLTNNSHWEDAAVLRQCFFAHHDIQSELLQIAKRRLKAMHHVGLTEQLNNSVAALASVLGFRFADTGYKSVSRNDFMYDGPDVDLGQYVTYTSRVHSGKGKGDATQQGETVRITLLEARRRLSQYNSEATRLNAELTPKEGDLQFMVDEEEKWLEEQEKLKEKEKEIVWLASKRLEKVVDAVSEAAVSVRAKAVSLLPSAVQERLRSVFNMHAADEEEEEENNEDEEEEEENEDVGDEVGRENEKIESPWADKIVRLDKKVYALQQKFKRLRHDIDALSKIPGVKMTLDQMIYPAGRGQLMFHDAHYLENTTLGKVYLSCSKSSVSRATNKRRSAFKLLRTPWDESFAFSSAARKQIPADILNRIRKLNAADMELYKLGKSLLENSLREQEKKGILEFLPPVEESSAGKKEGRVLEKEDVDPGIVDPQSILPEDKEVDKEVDNDDDNDEYHYPSNLSMSTDEGDAMDTHEEL